MSHLLYLMFRCDGDVMENLDFGGFFGHLNTPQVKNEALMKLSQSSSGDGGAATF